MIGSLRCPVCKADNTGPTCRRCKTDLSILWQVERQRAEALYDAAAALRAGDAFTARWAAECAHDLRPAPDSKRLMILAALTARDFPLAYALARTKEG